VPVANHVVMNTPSDPHQEKPAPLTGRERFRRLYDFQPVDRGVHWEAVSFWGRTIQEWKDLGGLPADADAMSYYGIDPRRAVSGGLGLTSITLSGPPITSRVIETDGRTSVYEDDLGKICKVRADGESMPQWLKFPVESHKDWIDKIKPRLDPREHNFETLAREVEWCSVSHDPVGMYLAGLYAFWRAYWGEEKLAYAFYDCPDTIHDMAKVWLAMHCECTPRLMESATVDYVLFHEDMAFKNGPLIGPHMFDEFMAPYYRELFSHLRGRGQRRFMLDSDGNNGLVLERFVDMGMNGLFPFEVAAGCDAIEFRSRHPEFVIWGAIDKRTLLKTKEDVKREVMSKVPVLWEQGGYIPCLDHSLMPCPQENFEYYLELVRSLTG
jgi:hypothetical protein